MGLAVIRRVEEERKEPAVVAVQGAPEEPRLKSERLHQRSEHTRRIIHGEIAKVASYRVVIFVYRCMSLLLLLLLSLVILSHALTAKPFAAFS